MGVIKNLTGVARYSLDGRSLGSEVVKLWDLKNGKKATAEFLRFAAYRDVQLTRTGLYNVSRSGVTVTYTVPVSYTDPQGMPVQGKLVVVVTPSGRQ